MSDSGAADADGACPSVPESSVPESSVPEFVEPQLLSQTGLYAEGASGALAKGVFEYRPQFELWSDGASKRRFVYLPPCAQIDTSDMDFWTYPRGTKLWKEFTRDNADGEPVRVETRLLEKYTKTKWFMTAFVWDEAQTDAQVGASDSEDTFVLQQNAGGTEHDVPGRAACSDCHGGMWDKVLGFSALQLSAPPLSAQPPAASPPSAPAEPDVLDLQRLIDDGLLTEPPRALLHLPGTAMQVETLGYLHANCGHCHNPNAKEANLGLEFWAQGEFMASVAETTAYASTINLETQSPETPKGEPALRVVPGSLEQSAVYWRITQAPVYPAMPEGGAHMPMIGSELTDPRAVELIGDWILGTAFE